MQMIDSEKENKLLNHINSPADLKGLPLRQLEILASEIRKKIIRTVSKTGGHLAPSLGVVESWRGRHPCSATQNIIAACSAFKGIRMPPN